MKKIVVVLLLAAALFAVYWFKSRGDDGPSAPKQQALTVGKHSPEFNAGIDSLINAYVVMKDAFVAGDSLSAKQSAGAFVTVAKRTKLDDLKKDTTGIFATAEGLLGDILRNAESIGQQQTLADMRLSLRDVSDNMYSFIKAIHYEGSKLYWQTCPMALGADQRANWISKDVAIVNPYLGKSHVEQNCGEIQDTIKAQ